MKRRSFHFIWMLVLALATLLIAVAVALAFISNGLAKWEALGFKILELSVQMVLISVLGGVLVQAYIRWHSRASSINEFRKTTAEAVISEYSDIKKMRRLIRATCVQGPGGTEIDPWTDIWKTDYDKYMSSVIDAQLALEIIKRRLGLLGGAFSGAKDLVCRAELMENYLGDIIGEYEKHRSKLNLDPVPLSELKLLRAFIAGKPDENPNSDFDKFREPFDQLLELLKTGGIWVAI